MQGSKAIYRISFRVLSVASGQFLAEVSASIHGTSATQGDNHSESRLYSSLEMATVEVGAMVEAMKGRLVSAGHDVLEATPPIA